ncbi:hypothetical protein Tco_1394996 [Tanacetum coccineum]
MFFRPKGKCNESSNQGWQQDFDSTFTPVNLERTNFLHDEILHEHQIKSSVKMQSQDIQINPVQAMDDSLIVSKSSLIEPENNNAFSNQD